MARRGRIHIIPRPKDEPDLDQLVLGLLAALDELPGTPISDLAAGRQHMDGAGEDVPERRAS